MYPSQFPWGQVLPQEKKLRLIGINEVAWIEHMQTCSVHVLHQDGETSYRQLSYLVRWLVSIASLAESEITREMVSQGKPCSGLF